MGQFQRCRRAIARDVQRTIRNSEQTLSEARTLNHPADEVVAAIEDHKASRRGQKIKEPPAG